MQVAANRFSQCNNYKLLSKRENRDPLHLYIHWFQRSLPSIRSWHRRKEDWDGHHCQEDGHCTPAPHSTGIHSVQSAWWDQRTGGVAVWSTIRCYHHPMLQWLHACLPEDSSNTLLSCSRKCNQLRCSMVSRSCNWSFLSVTRRDVVNGVLVAGVAAVME